MGYSILELVLRALRQENFNADIAYPGQKYPQITESVLAVHISKVDRANLTVTIEVNVICPAALGGTACEMVALRATEVLRWEGAVCVQNGCTYDGVGQVYVVPILATFTGRGSYLWHIQLEELIPAGSPETDEPPGAFQLKIVTDQKTEIYYSCRWNKIRREFTQKGLRRVRSGIAMLREEK